MPAASAPGTHTAPVQVDLVADPAEFADRTGEWLASEPFTANVIAVLLDGVVAGTRSTIPDPAWVMVTDAAGGVIGAAMHTSPIGVFLARLPTGAAAAIAREFARVGRVVAGVSGERSAADEFAAAWEAVTGSLAGRIRAERMFRLAGLAPPASVPGAARAAGSGDVELAVDWFTGFAADIGEHSSSVAEPAEAARRRTVAAEVMLWENEAGVVSLAAVSPSAGGVARIGPVYTPPAHRRHGFAAAVTAAAASRAVATGAREVVLYTDLANPTSNGVYRRLGFEPVFDSARLAFETRG